MTKMTNEQVAKRFGCTVDQVKAQFARNAAELANMADQAMLTGKPVNHYTEAQLRKMADEAFQRSLP
jgi:hypothetical protein